MFQLGQNQILTVAKVVGFGVYLAERIQAGAAQEAEEELRSGDEVVLLPKSQLPEGGLSLGDEIEVFLYKDSEDRIIATRKEPLLQLHEVGFLTVKQVGRIGAFLDWGLDKDLLLPFHEQPRDRRVKEGEEILVGVYLDKSSRLCATMNVYPYLRKDSPYRASDRVTGTVYETSDNFGVFVAVDNLYSALVPKRELVRPLRIGETVSARVTAVKPDGKLDLSLRESGLVQIESDAQVILRRLEENGGVLAFTDKADPDFIREQMQMSKNEFKRAVGRLLKEGKIEIGDGEIRLR
ncbi:MAG: S1-like domain-containing RNA-binding protein [Eubacteriales bacterium]|nr:S1-like domain-containing RNA-binding protein [Eubacteriales bacterium]